MKIYPALALKELLICFWHLTNFLIFLNSHFSARSVECLLHQSLHGRSIYFFYIVSKDHNHQTTVMILRPRINHIQSLVEIRYIIWICLIQRYTYLNIVNHKWRLFWKKLIFNSGIISRAGKTNWRRFWAWRIDNWWVRNGTGWRIILRRKNCIQRAKRGRTTLQLWRKNHLYNLQKNIQN